MNLSMFSKHYCPGCKTVQVFDSLCCTYSKCRYPLPLSEVRIVTDYQFGQTPEQAGKRLKRAADRERAKGRGRAISIGRRA